MAYPHTRKQLLDPSSVLQLVNLFGETKELQNLEVQGALQLLIKKVVLILLVVDDHVHVFDLQTVIVFVYILPSY